MMDRDLQDLLAFWLGDHDPGEERRTALLARLAKHPRQVVVRDFRSRPTAGMKASLMILKFDHGAPEIRTIGGD